MQSFYAAVRALFRKLSPTQGHEAIFMLSSGSFILKPSIFISMTHLKLFMCIVSIGTVFHFFPFGYPTDLALLPFLIILSCQFCQKSSTYACVGLFLVSIVSFGLFVYSFPSIVLIKVTLHSVLKSGRKVLPLGSSSRLS